MAMNTVLPMDLAFSYAALTPAEATTIRDAACAIRSVLHRGGIEIGRNLASVKAILPHGAFAAWAETELGISPRSASRYIGVAKFLEGNRPTWLICRRARSSA